MAVNAAVWRRLKPTVLSFAFEQYVAYQKEQNRVKQAPGTSACARESQQAVQFEAKLVKGLQLECFKMRRLKGRVEG